MSHQMQKSRIIGIQFGMLSPEEIRRNSVVELVSRDTYATNNRPRVGGLFDPRMGVLEPGLICPTDGKNYIDCPGYFGHIELARPIINAMHLRDILKILKVICLRCSKLLISKQDHLHALKMPASARWQYVISNVAKIKSCGEKHKDGCGCLVPKIELDGMTTIQATYPVGDEPSAATIIVTPEMLIKIFKRISDEDVNFMGFSPIFSRPEWMIFTALPIPPPAMRPSVKHDAQTRSEDDVSNLISNVIRTNLELKAKLEKEDADPRAIEGLTNVLQYFVAMIGNNKLRGSAPMQQRSGRVLQSIFDRLNSKFGRIRGNLMGKRVDFSARSVITGDPTLSIRQLGVPLKVAMNITKPVMVNDRNRAFLMKLVQNGPEEHPGAKILERKGGDHISLRYVDRNAITLENGDIVHRHMMDGDGVLFNRQPSLHRMSMMCHIVKVMKKGNTFRMNVADTKPYNADFDGDEMNMHMPQNPAAEIELKQLAHVPFQMVSPASASPIVGIFQDSMLGSYRFTRPDVKFSPKDAMNLMVTVSDVDLAAFFKEDRAVKNFDMITQIMQPITLKYKTKLFRDGEDYETTNNVMEIVNGKYVRGQMEKSVLGSASKGIIHRIFNDYGSSNAAKFIDNLQDIITKYMTTSSYSVGISDLLANRQTNERIVETITDQKQQVKGLIDKVHMGIFENSTANTNIAEFETQVTNILNKATERAGKIGRESLDKSNRFLMIVESGAKGSLVNISQMISCVGQTSVEGKRVPYGFQDRTLPHFSRYDDSPMARGFIENSYITGLTAPELFFHAMGGRIGLIDTAVKTSQTGYIQRRLIKGLEDLKVEYDMTVRNNKSKIVQFAYGEDGFDATKVEFQALPLTEMTTEQIYMHYDIVGVHENRKGITSIYTKGVQTRMRKQTDNARAKCKEYIDMMIALREGIIDKVHDSRGENGVKVPVSFHHLINNVAGQMNLSPTSTVDITPLEAFELIEHYYQRIRSFHYSEENDLFRALYYFYLTPRTLLVMKRFHRAGLVMLLENVILRYKEALVHPGEMVGVIAGQSIGEPTTQLTLNTFHLAGVASKSNVTRGVPRIEEILRLTKNPKGPSLTVFLNKYEQEDRKKAGNYASMLGHTSLGNITKQVQVCFDPTDSVLDADSTLISQYNEFESLMNECAGDDAEETFDKSKWVIRIEMDADSMLDRNISMDDVHFAISNAYDSMVQCVYADYNDSNLVFRLRVSNTLFKKSKQSALEDDIIPMSDDLYLLRNFQESLLNSVVLRGIPNIKNVNVRKMQNYMVETDTGFVPKDIWVMDTAGTNLLDALGLDYIDPYRTVSNDIKEVHEVLGIEAARRVIHDEFVDVMEFSGVSINYHHLSLLCDRMALTKNLVSIFRSGILNDDIGPIAKSTFEVHTEVLLAASRHGEFDDARGVSASVMLGQLGNYGTGMHSILLDMKEMQGQEGELYEKKDSRKNVEEALAARDDACERDVQLKNHLHTFTSTDVDCVVEDDGYEMDF